MKLISIGDDISYKGKNYHVQDVCRLTGYLRVGEVDEFGLVPSTFWLFQDEDVILMEE